MKGYDAVLWVPRQDVERGAFKVPQNCQMTDYGLGDEVMVSGPIGSLYWAVPVESVWGTSPLAGLFCSVPDGLLSKISGGTYAQMSFTGAEGDCGWELAQHVAIVPEPEPEADQPVEVPAR